jgi:nucleoside-diphosphate-sugar epimerase
MVVGKGLLARAFSKYREDNSVLVFASGVSNSAEQSVDAYAREFELLANYSTTNMKLIYFSTVSILDQDLQDSSYIKHKLQMEQYIANTFSSYVIFRLPNVVGVTTNNNTFFNGIKNKIAQDKRVCIKKDAIRYLIDIEDLSNLLPSVIERVDKVTMNINFNNKSSVQRLVGLIGRLLGMEYEEVLVDGGSNYTPDNTQFLSYIPNNSVGFTEDYDYIVLKKYLHDNILPTK